MCLHHVLVRSFCLKKNKKKKFTANKKNYVCVFMYINPNLSKTFGVFITVLMISK